MSTVEVMVTAQVQQSTIVALQRHFTVHHREHIQDPSVLHRVRAVVCEEGSRISRDWMALLPHLELICLTGPDAHGVDLAEAQRRQITVLPGPAVAVAERADFAVGVLLGLCRRWPDADRFVRDGDWVDGPFPLAHRFSGLRVGLVGLGATGLALIRRLAAFDVSGAYVAAERVADCPWPQAASLSALAQQVNVLVVLDEALAKQAGPLGGELLGHLQAPAYVVCLVRSSVLDEASVVDALKRKTLTGLALDDYPEAPRVPAAWRQAPNTWVTPSMAGVTLEAQADIAQAVIQGIRQHFGVQPGSPS